MNIAIYVRIITTLAMIVLSYFETGLVTAFCFLMIMAGVEGQNYNIRKQSDVLISLINDVSGLKIFASHAGES